MVLILYSLDIFYLVLDYIKLDFVVLNANVNARDFAVATRDNLVRDLILNVLADKVAKVARSALAVSRLVGDKCADLAVIGQADTLFTERLGVFGEHKLGNSLVVFGGKTAENNNLVNSGDKLGTEELLKALESLFAVDISFLSAEAENILLG